MLRGLPTMGSQCPLTHGSQDQGSGSRAAGQRATLAFASSYSTFKILKSRNWKRGECHSAEGQLIDTPPPSNHGAEPSVAVDTLIPCSGCRGDTHHSCLETIREHQVPGTRVTDCYELLLCGFWELQLGPLEDQPVFLQC